MVDYLQALKTEWFRSRERYRRWEEQLVLLKREMVMTIRSFQRYQELWEWKSQRPSITPGMRAYACSRGKFFAELAYQMLVASRKQLYVSIGLAGQAGADTRDSRTILLN